MTDVFVPYEVLDHAFAACAVFASCARSEPTFVTSCVTISLRVERHLHVVANKSRAAPARRHRAAVGIGQRNLLADRQDLSETLTLKKVRIKEKLEKLKSEMAKLVAIERHVLASPDHAIKKVCARFVEPCRRMGLLSKASVAMMAASSKQ